MSKNLSNASENSRLTERIAARKLKKKPSQAAINKALFLALKDEIKEAMGDGHNVFCIWETLHEEGKLKFSYETFRKYVNRIIRAHSDNTNQQIESVAKNTENTNTAQKESFEIPSFKHNPIPNIEELY